MVNRKELAGVAKGLTGVGAFESCLNWLFEDSPKAGDCFVEISGMIGFKPKMVEGPPRLTEGVIIYDIGDIPPTLGSGNFIEEAFVGSLMMTCGEG